MLFKKIKHIPFAFTDECALIKPDQARTKIGEANWVFLNSRKISIVLKSKENIMILSLYVQFEVFLNLYLLSPDIYFKIEQLNYKKNIQRVTTNFYGWSWNTANY